MSTVIGRVSPGFEEVLSYLENARADDADYSFQLAVYSGAELVVDLHAGEGISAESLMIPFSTSKNSIAFSIGLLVERGLLDLDAPVAAYWPEFAAEGKHNVLVRELLSHQAGLPEAKPRITDEEFADAEQAAARLAAQLPWWRPGSTFGYHGLTIGVLGGELVRRVTGLTIQEFFEQEIRSTRNIDFYLGSSPELEERVVELQPMITKGGPVDPRTFPFPRQPGQLGREVFANAAVQRTEEETLVHSRSQRIAANPAAYATVNARGIAALFAECVVGVTGPALLSASTVQRLAQSQVRGTDSVIGIERNYGVVFQKPTPNLAFGGFRAFGHDGAGGALGFHDPDTQISFGYTVRRTPPPGGADSRALEVARILQSIALSQPRT